MSPQEIDEPIDAAAFPLIITFELPEVIILLVCVTLPAEWVGKPEPINAAALLLMITFWEQLEIIGVGGNPHAPLEISPILQIDLDILFTFN